MTSPPCLPPVLAEVLAEVLADGRFQASVGDGNGDLAGSASWLALTDANPAYPRRIQDQGRQAVAVAVVSTALDQPLQNAKLCLQFTLLAQC